MGFTNVSHRISISREALICLIVDNKAVSCLNQKGEILTIRNASNHQKNDFDRSSRPRKHDFLATVEFNGRIFGRAKVSLSTTAFRHYIGKIEYEEYPDDNVSE